jgi:hypothetical protein
VVIYICWKGHGVFSLGRGRAVSHPWNTELIHQHAEPAREKGFLIGMRTLQLFESALNARSGQLFMSLCLEEEFFQHALSKLGHHNDS